jgi:hypothetical protein
VPCASLTNPYIANCKYDGPVMFVQRRCYVRESWVSLTGSKRPMGGILSIISINANI